MTRIEVPGHDVVGVRAANPGPFSLSGTNSWIVARDPATLIDPGPALPEHVEALKRELTARGGLASILLTHDHADHAEAVPDLQAAFPEATFAAARGEAGRILADGDRAGPLTVFATPGHAADHLAFLFGAVLFTGDAVLGEGSVFVAPEPGALAGYLAALSRLRALPLDAICPGHGPLVLDPHAKLETYLTHRLERERRLLAALDAGGRSIEELLDAAWSEVPPGLRPAAAVTLAAHLDKLEDEGRLPAGVERPQGIAALLRLASGAH